MEYRLGNSKKLYSTGETEVITCPNCDKKVKMSVFQNFEFRLKADFPLFDTGNVFCLVCPECAAVFGVNEAQAKVFKKGEKLAIGNFDLKELERFDV